MPHDYWLFECIHFINYAIHHLTDIQVLRSLTDFGIMQNIQIKKQISQEEQNTVK